MNTLTNTKEPISPGRERKETLQLYSVLHYEAVLGWEEKVRGEAVLAEEAVWIDPKWQETARNTRV